MNSQEEFNLMTIEMIRVINIQLINIYGVLSSLTNDANIKRRINDNKAMLSEQTDVRTIFDQIEED